MYLLVSAAATASALKIEDVVLPTDGTKLLMNKLIIDFCMYNFNELIVGFITKTRVSEENCYPFIKFVIVFSYQTLILFGYHTAFKIFKVSNFCTNMAVTVLRGI